MVVPNKQVPEVHLVRQRLVLRHVHHICVVILDVPNNLVVVVRIIIQRQHKILTQLVPLIVFPIVVQQQGVVYKLVVVVRIGVVLVQQQH